MKIHRPTRRALRGASLAAALLGVLALAPAPALAGGPSVRFEIEVPGSSHRHHDGCGHHDRGYDRGHRHGHHHDDRYRDDWYPRHRVRYWVPGYWSYGHWVPGYWAWRGGYRR